MVFNIDGNKIRDLDSLKKEIQHDNKFRDFMTDVVLGKVTVDNYAHMKYQNIQQDNKYYGTGNSPVYTNICSCRNLSIIGI